MRDQSELELKWALTAGEHARLRERLTAAHGAARPLAQVNRFFDTADRRLRAARMNLRIRNENGHLILTCKRHLEATNAAQLTDGLSSHQEWETDLSAAAHFPDMAHLATSAHPSATWTAALPLPEPIRATLDGHPLQALGGFANHRDEWHLTRGGIEELLCLDRTEFATRIDYELEIETPDPTASAAHWRTIFATWDIPVVPQILTKFARYLKLSPLDSLGMRSERDLRI